MAFYRIPKNYEENLSKIPEVAMDIHMAVVHGELVVVVGMRLAVSIDEEAISQARAIYNGERTLTSPGQDRFERNFAEWESRLNAVDNLEVLEHHNARSALMYMRTSGRYPFSPPPPPSSVIFGHLPFEFQSTTNDVFYRFEAYPSSRRIKGNKIMAGTYAAPASELFFTPTGLSAVGRFALPSLLPACWRYELQPSSGSVIHCGASVPLYGQSGGAVEVCFPKPTRNRGPIANPVILPEL